MTISSTGDLGDCVYLLNIIRQIPGGPHTLCLRSSLWTKAKTEEGAQRLFNLLAPLVELQHYVKDFKVIQPDDVGDWASEGFRERAFSNGETLMQAHLNHLIRVRGDGQGITCKHQWLFGVIPAKVSLGRVVINRTPRYRNDKFPWGEIVKHYGEKLLFVGLPHEHEEFSNSYGSVEYHPTTNMLEVAQVILGSDLFIGNQSSAYALAEGMKHNTIQEVCLHMPDCVYVRPNAAYVPDEVVTLPCGTVIRGGLVSQDRRTHVTPPGAWQLTGYASNPTFELMCREVVRCGGIPLPQAEEAVYNFNVARCPEFFRDRADYRATNLFRQALENHTP